MSAIGKPGRPIYEIEKPYESWPILKDDIIKAICHTLLRENKQLLAVSDDAIVLQIPDSENTIDGHLEYYELVRRVTESILSSEFVFHEAIEIARNIHTLTVLGYDYWPEPAR